MLQECTIAGNVVKLPPRQLGPELYTAVKKLLAGIGGTWKGGKIAGFVFDVDPTELLAAQAAGDGRNLKKEFQFFATPEPLALRMASLTSYRPGFRILEPSAGDGALLEAMRKRFGPLIIECCELMESNRQKLRRNGDNLLIAEDFLTEEVPSNHYHIIIANPPFSNNQDIEHIRKMWDCLAPGGTLVTITSHSSMRGSIRKQLEFADWVMEVGAMWEELPRGTFSESGTQVPAMLLRAIKPFTELPHSMADTPLS